ncbi:M23 family metallopeptidase [Haloglycomyces albus]|uniref:M23 family metallopeptidase n=1 Tax=Haloglycomyces albus TaxID=526067 RepID=UPI00046D5C28|nr:M23 family metallopeptidase [Haloglycomyces albus]
MTLGAQRFDKPVRRWKRLLIGLVSVVAVCCIGVVFTFVQVFSGDDDDGNNYEAYWAGCGNDVEVDPDDEFPPVPPYSSEQVQNAAIIVSVGQEMDIPARGWVVAVATAMQESRITNLGHLGDDNDHDSLGLFQQRPSTGWGTPEEIMDPVYASTKFYEKLQTIDGWEALPLTEAAQAVQRSAFPGAYAKHETKAGEIVNVLTGGGGRVSGVSVNLGECAGPGDISALGWTSPVPGEPVSSSFRTMTRPDHHGVDIMADPGTPIYAAASGRVIKVLCNAYTGAGDPYSCDVDGSPAILGCGWYVDIQHAAGYITRYCHMKEEPYVKPGQYVKAGEQIGIVGSSGNSSGPHLHYEVHVNDDGSASGAVDPIPFMEQVGAELG